MAYVNTSRASATSLAEKFATLRANLRDTFAKRRVYRTTLNELQALSDRELNDLGLARSAIRGIAMEAAYGK